MFFSNQIQKEDHRPKGDSHGTEGGGLLQAAIASARSITDLKSDYKSIECAVECADTADDPRVTCEEEDCPSDLNLLRKNANRRLGLGLAVPLFALAAAVLMFSNGSVTTDEVVTYPLFRSILGEVVIPVGINLNFGMVPKIDAKDVFFRGFKLNSQGLAIQDDVLEGNHNLVPDVQKYIKKTITSTVEEMNDFLQISAGFNVPFGPFAEIGPELEFIKNNVSTRNTVVILISVRQSICAEKGDIDTYKTSPDVANKLAAGLESAVYDEYGTYVVTQIKYGSELYIKFTVSSNNEFDTARVEASLKSALKKNPVTNIGVSFNTTFTKLNKVDELDFSIEAASYGVTFPVPLTGNLNTTQLDDIILDYDKQHGELSKDCTDYGKMAPIAIVLTPISSIPSFPHSISDATVDKVKVKMAGLSTALAETKFLKAELEKQEDYFDTKYPDGADREDVYEKWHIAYDKVLKEIIEPKLAECYAFRGLTFDELQTAEVPKKLTFQQKEPIKGLLGTDYIQPPMTMEGGDYTGMGWSGYALQDDNGKMVPFYYGYAECKRTKKVVAGPGRLNTFDYLISLDACTQSPSCKPPGWGCGWYNKETKANAHGWCDKCCFQPGKWKYCRSDAYHHWDCCN